MHYPMRACSCLGRGRFDRVRVLSVITTLAQRIPSCANILIAFSLPPVDVPSRTSHIYSASARSYANVTFQRTTFNDSPILPYWNYTYEAISMNDTRTRGNSLDYTLRKWHSRQLPLRLSRNDWMDLSVTNILANFGGYICLWAGLGGSLHSQVDFAGVTPYGVTPHRTHSTVGAPCVTTTVPLAFYLLVWGTVVEVSSVVRF
jgi:hypothetical protein